MNKLSPTDAVWAANEFITYYQNFNRIDDYFRMIKADRIGATSASLFGPEDDIFSDFSVHPSQMKFSIHTVDTSPKPTSKYNQALYAEVLNLTASNAVEEAIPGRTIKWIVNEDTTDKIIGVVRFGSPTINSKPRNIYFDGVVPLKQVNAEFVMDSTSFQFNLSVSIIWVANSCVSWHHPIILSVSLIRSMTQTSNTSRQPLCMDPQREFPCMMD